ncbi:glycosyltransferase [Nocardioides dongxiaopingii]|uniref:glycosyltransferase n=1 Tax=Nocardioides sp. S-1144 TaxID=2582905 RepID=UPI001C9E5D37|nr:glycosyltransferase [Nocardioides sp. S-1144]
MREDDPCATGLSVVMPCYNEAGGLDDVLDELLDELDREPRLDVEVVCVDDGSRDGTLDVLRRRAAADPRVQYLSFTRNFGVEAAFSAGYLYASKPWLVHVDADGQFPPSEIRRLIEASDGMDAVFGVRVQRHDPLVRRIGSTVNQLVARGVLGIELPRHATCFRLVRTELARAVVDLRLGSPYFLATLPKLTDRHTTVPIAHRARTDGPARVRFLHLAGHALDLWFAFSRRPAQFAILTAIWAAVVSVALGVLHMTRALPAPVMEGGIVVLVGIALFVIAVEVRCLGVLAAGQPRPRMFYVREASVPVLPADTFGSVATGRPVGPLGAVGAVGPVGPVAPVEVAS